MLKKWSRCMVSKAVANKSDRDYDVERRKSNIIIYRVEESSSDETETRKLGDTAFFKELSEGPLALGPIQDSMIGIISLGKKGENNLMRPMLIKLRSRN